MNVPRLTLIPEFWARVQRAVTYHDMISFIELYTVACGIGRASKASLTISTGLDTVSKLGETVQTQ